MIRATLGITLCVLSPALLATQQINIAVQAPPVPGQKIEVVSCPAFDSLLPPGKKKLKTAIFLATIGSDSNQLYTSEPYTSSKGKDWAWHYLWASARVQRASTSTIPDTSQLAMWAWASPIITTETPPHPRLGGTLDDGISLDLGELRTDPGHEVRFSTHEDYPTDGQVVYSLTSSESLLRLVAARKARITWPDGWFKLDDYQRAGIVKVLMAARCDAR